MNIEQLQVQVEKSLDEYERFSGLPPFTIYDSEQAAQYFTMTLEQLNNLSPVECAEAAYILAQYSFYFQRTYNRESARHKWALSQMSKLICDKMGGYPDFTKYDHKVELIAKENAVVAKLQNLINYTAQMMERMNFLSSSIKNMCETMSNIQKAKSYSQKAASYE